MQYVLVFSPVCFFFFFFRYRFGGCYVSGIENGMVWFCYMDGLKGLAKGVNYMIAVILVLLVTWCSFYAFFCLLYFSSVDFICGASRSRDLPGMGSPELLRKYPTVRSENLRAVQGSNLQYTLTMS